MVPFLALVSLSISASELASLRSELQAIVDRHSAFWNASMSFAVYNSSVDVAVAAGKNDYAAGTWLTNATRIPMGSTTKQFTAVAALRLPRQQEPLHPLRRPAVGRVCSYSRDKHK